MQNNISEVMEILKNHFNLDRRTTLNRMRGQDPYKILIGCLVSINIKDEVTEKILEELFSKAGSFQNIIDMDIEKLLVKSLDEDSLRNANAVFMLHGKNICVPSSPFCSKCPVSEICRMVGV